MCASGNAAVGWGTALILAGLAHLLRGTYRLIRHSILYPQERPSKSSRWASHFSALRLECKDRFFRAARGFSPPWLTLLLLLQWAVVAWLDLGANRLRYRRSVFGHPPSMPAVLAAEDHTWWHIGSGARRIAV